ncbi:MAG: preprotein translocase subunit SecA [Bacteroidetes bacterium]|nr:preprotein translocase subunit SecA [Bacteroidota bacterium]
MLKFLGNLFGNKHERDALLLRPVADEINRIWNEEVKNLSNDDLRLRTLAFKKQISDHIAEDEKIITGLKEKAEQADDLNEKENLYREADQVQKKIFEKIFEKLIELLPAAFATVKETARRFKENATLVVTTTEHDQNLALKKSYVSVNESRTVWSNSWVAGGNKITWDMVHYDVQLMGGVVLHQGKISEMATGEGKTLVATLPLYLNALAGKGCHLVTVNDYLSKRDQEWMGPIYEFLMLTVDCIDKYEPHSPGRRNAYLSDITYGTNSEFGFDYLRDNMVRETIELVQRGHFYAIVDEVDSVLIDDARTPLIISGPTGKDDKQLFYDMKPRVEKLISAQKNYVNKILNEARQMLEKGDEKNAGLPLFRSHRGLPRNKALIKLLSETGNKTLMQKTENFYLQDNSREMPKADSELFFVIDEKNNSVELTDKGIELITASGEDPHFFVLPDIGVKIAEIEKTAITDKEKLMKKDELMRDFSVKGERIHSLHQLVKAYTLFEKDDEYVILDGKVKIVDEQTGRIMEGRRYSDGLHQAIEAKENVKVEAATQTYATITLQNYFRMYKKLAGMTGTAETEAGEFWNIYKLDVVVVPTNLSCVRKDNEDLVYKTKREKYNAVIEEINNLVKAGRPVLVGTTSVEVSELLSRMLKMRGIKHNVLNAKQHQREAEIVAEAGRAGTVTIATNMAGRGTDIKLGPGVKDTGGLAIIGTERHESRRVDRQLRGRAGRQGDPGTSQFFVSLEDDLMRLFGSDRIARWMDRLKVPEGEVIQHSLITRSIERAQKKVEENNFGQRKRLLEYDDVMNIQREAIYSKRKHALYGERLTLDIITMLYDLIENITTAFQQERDYNGFQLELLKNCAMESGAGETDFMRQNVGELTEKVFSEAVTHYRNKSQFTAEKAYPVLKNVFETEGSKFENIVVPFSDGLRMIQVVANLKKSYESGGKEVFSAFEKTVSLAIIDDIWKEHLREMDDLRQSVHGAVYEQKDPLLIYKFEAFNLFKAMMMKINRDVISFLFKGDIPGSDGRQQVNQAQAPRRTDMSGLHTGRAPHPDQRPQMTEQANTGQQRAAQPVRVEKKAGRNDPCPCGSGKKFKHCHGR